MSSEVVESYLSNIEEYVLDEKRIVTCSWLAKTLGIHCNLAKQLLYTFTENYKNKEQLCATYLISGTPKNGSGCRVSVVKEKDLQALEASLEWVTSKHVYSVQRSSDLPDLQALFTAQKDASHDIIAKGISAINFNCKERDDALLAKLRLSALPARESQPVAAAKKPAQPAAKTKSPVKNTKADSVDKKDSEEKSENKKVIPSMFKNTADSKKKPAGKATANNKKTQGIGAFFSKAPSKPAVEPKKNVDEPKVKEEKKPEPKVEERLSPLKENKATLNICNESKPKKEESPKAQQKESPVKSKKVEAKPKRTSKKSEAKHGKKSSAKAAPKDQKKRKRLMVMSDSDSNNTSEEEEEAEREPTPEPQAAVVPDDDEDIVCATPEPQTRKRKKKLVSKTFTSDEGYIVTKKEYVDASSEEEDAVPEKKFKGTSSETDDLSMQSDKKPDQPSASVKKDSPKEKKSSPQKTKQASLMNFFKKK